MFDLEKAIKEWVKAFNKHQAFGHGSSHEMELHLRDHIEDLVSDGCTEEDAFVSAVKEFGEIPTMAKEEFWNQERTETPWLIMRSAMLKNFYFVAIRSLIKHKSYFLINVCGLAIGIASFAFISLYIINELSYDRFHSNHENIYRVNSESYTKGHSAAADRAVTNAPLAKQLVAKYPEVANATRLTKTGPVLIEQGDKKIMEDQVYYADSAFLKVFDFKLLKGDPNTALIYPRSMVLSEDYARKYFGDLDPMGKPITIDEDTTFYTVTGVVENVPANSHIQFDMLGSMSTKRSLNNNKWIGTSVYTYALLSEHTDKSKLEEKIQEIIDEFVGPEIEYYTGTPISEWKAAGNRGGYYLISLKDIHLRSTSSDELAPTGDILYIYIYGLIGAIILLIAIFNFVNLATAHSSSRAKEVGVRKVIGSTKSNLIYQFIFDSIIVSIVATLFSIVLIYFFTPNFYELIGKELAYGITSSYLGPTSMLVLALLVGLLAGIYPAFVLSAFKPVDVLKGTVKSGAKSGWLRNVLVTLQFTASIVIIIVTLVIYNQIEFMLAENLGFNKEKILVVKRPDGLGKNIEVFKNDLLQNPAIVTVSNSSAIPGKTYKIRAYRKYDDPKDETFVFKNNQVSYEHFALMEFELVSGRFFSKEFSSDSNALVINEAAAKAFGFESPIGKTLRSVWKKGRPLPIIGVIKDYNTESLHKNIEPITLELDHDNSEGYVSMKLKGTQNVSETLAFIEDSWYRHASGMPFQYFFFNQDYQNLYKSESTAGQVLIVFAGLSIFIACMGLIGLISYTASVRRKEIGIRKVLGADTSTLIGLLSKKIIQLFVVATLIAWPLAYVGSGYWLQNFTNRIVTDPWLYIAATISLTLVVACTISFQTIKAALSNPVDSLRQE